MEPEWVTISIIEGPFGFLLIGTQKVSLGSNSPRQIKHGKGADHTDGIRSPWVPPAH